MTTIYVTKRRDIEWAEFVPPKRAEVLRTLTAETRGEWDAIAARETGRVRTLCERAAEEAPSIPHDLELPAPLPRGFWRNLWRRLKWLFTGK